MKTKPKKIFWIEDDIDGLGPLIDPEHFEIRECRTYSEALRSFPEMETFDLILLDFLIPPGDIQEEEPELGFGFALLKRLLEDKLANPIIVFSSYGLHPVVNRECAALGVKVLYKPIRPSKLKAEILDSIERASQTAG